MPSIDRTKPTEGELLFAKMQEYLARMNRTPKVEHGAELPSSTRGDYDGRTIRLAPRAENSTLLHEMAHATHSALRDQFYKEFRNQGILGLLQPTATPETTQFQQAFEKLVFRGSQGAMAARVAPSWAKEESNYRSGSEETSAFGVGNTLGKAPMKTELHSAPPHIDATAATEFQLILDLAIKALNSQGKPK